METLVDKRCFYCSESCADQPRVKDKRGRYAHKSCQAALSKPEPGKRSKRSRRKSTSRSTATPEPDFLADLPDLIPSIYHTVAPCPTCSQRVHPRAVLCTNCGTDLTQHVAPYTASYIEAKPFALNQDDRDDPVRSPVHQLAHPLGLACGSILAGASWLLVAPSADPTATMLAAATAATLLILGSTASRLISRSTFYRQPEAK